MGLVLERKRKPEHGKGKGKKESRAGVRQDTTQRDEAKPTGRRFRDEGGREGGRDGGGGGWLVASQWCL